MRLWEVKFVTQEPVDYLPRLNEIVFERQVSPEYHVPTRPRCFNDTQIVCTMSGEGFFSIHGKEYRLTPGKVFLCCLAEPTSTYGYPVNGSEPWEFLWVSFIGAPSVAIIREFNRKFGFVTDIHSKQDFILALQFFRKQNEKIQFHSSVHAACEAMRLLDLFEQSQQEREPGPEVIRQAQQMIMEYPSLELSIKKIAKELHISREHLSRLFREVTGDTIGSFAARERMHLAQQLLRDELLTCDEVASRLGFSSSSSFARAYRQMFGTPPSRLRNG